MEDDTIIERITGKKVFKKGKIYLKITTLTRGGIGYEIVSPENCDYGITDIENILNPALIGHSATDQDFIDSIISDCGIEDTAITMGASVSVGRCAANTLELPFFKYIGGALSTSIPLVISDILTDGKNSLLILPNSSSIEDVIELYSKIILKLSEIYGKVDIDGVFHCKNIFAEVDNVKEIITDIGEEEDIEIQYGISLGNDNYSDKINGMDYLEHYRPIDFDGMMVIDGLDSGADGSKIDVYSLETITELYYYINYILEEDLIPILVGETTSQAHLSVGFRIPYIRCSTISNILNELWDIERILINPDNRRRY